MKIFNNNSGITLAEVIVGSFIFTLIVGSFLSILLTSSASLKLTDYIYVSTNLAKSRIERLKGLDYNSLPNAEETDTRLDKNGNPDIDGDFYRTTEVTPIYNGVADMTEISVSVYYVLGEERSEQPIVVKTLFVKP